MHFSSVRPIVVASHPRSGTHLLIDTLRRQFDACRTWKWPGERLDRLYCNIDELPGDGLLDESTARRILTRARRPILKTHSWPGYQRGFLDSHAGKLSEEWVDWINENATTFYVYRDGRDVLCSYQLFRKSFDPNARGPIGDFLRGWEGGENRVQRWVHHVHAWRNQSNAHLVPFETLLEEPEATLQRIGKALGERPRMKEPLLPPPLESVWESRLARLTGIRPESTAILNGESQDWNDSFTTADREFFQEQAGELLIELGYESSSEWIRSSSASENTP